MTKLVIKQPETEQEFKNYYQLRWQLLAMPWNQPIEISQDDKESTSYHLMALVEDEVAGISRLHLNTNTEAQIRYMGVTDSQQRQGIGTALIYALERYAKSLYVRTIILNAREIAIPFYKAQGYSYLQDAHIAFGVIKHVRMHKKLL